MTWWARPEVYRPSEGHLLNASALAVFSAVAILLGGLGLLATAGPPVGNDSASGGNGSRGPNSATAGIVWNPSDVRVSNPATQFPGEELSLFEPTLAVDPTDPDNILIVASDLSLQNVKGWDDVYAAVNRLYRSTDGGLSWVDMGYMRYGPSPSEIDGGDPVVLFALDGTAYFAALVEPPRPDGEGRQHRYIYLWRSTDGGATWTRLPAAFTPIVDEEADECTSSDKEWLSLGDEPGELLLTYTSATFQCSLEESPPIANLGLQDVTAITHIGVFLKRSPDGGETWGPAQEVWSGYGSGAIPKLGPDGTLYITFFATVTVSDGLCPSLLGLASTRMSPGRPLAATVVAVSHDDGATWDYHVEGMCEFIASELIKPGSLGGGTFLPSIAVDAGSGTVVVAFSSFQPAQGEFTIEVIRSGDGGESWTSPVDASPGPGDDYLPAVHAEGGVVRLLYVAATPDGLADTWLRESRDGGQSWSDPVRLSSVSGDLTQEGFIGDYNAVDFVGGRVAAVWTDARIGYPTEIWARTGTIPKGERMP